MLPAVDLLLGLQAAHHDGTRDVVGAGTEDDLPPTRRRSIRAGKWTATPSSSPKIFPIVKPYGTLPFDHRYFHFPTATYHTNNTRDTITSP